jgi:hypothetical protein
MTVIPMEPPIESTKASVPGRVEDPKAFRRAAEEELVSWSSKLLAATEGISRTTVVHGYTGRWSFEIVLEKWRTLVVSEPSQVVVVGDFNLFMPADGRGGTGQMQGRLQFEIHDAAGDDRFCVYDGEYHITHETKDACCAKDGSLELETQGFALSMVGGKLPPQLQHLHFEPWLATWRLSPSPEPAVLVGDFRMRDTVGSVKMRKRN